MPQRSRVTVRQGVDNDLEDVMRRQDSNLASVKFIRTGRIKHPLLHWAAREHWELGKSGGDNAWRKRVCAANDRAAVSGLCNSRGRR